MCDFTWFGAHATFVGFLGEDVGDIFCHPKRVTVLPTPGVSTRPNTSVCKDPS